jgi:mono/diheme cytochrome c family protein
MFQLLNRELARTTIPATATIAVISGLLVASLSTTGCQRVQKQDDAQSQPGAATGQTEGQGAAQTASMDPVARGKYLVTVGSCNDCHTPGYLPAAGKVDEKLWLTGDGFGWSGPWGTTYGTNLRLFAASLSEAQWLKHLDTMRPRPPMPWFNVQAMTANDRKALYAYLKAMGPAGQPAPAALPPGKQPPQPYALFPG